MKLLTIFRDMFLSVLYYKKFLMWDLTLLLLFLAGNEKK